MTKHNDAMLTVTSLLSILLLSIHVTDDIVRGFDKWGFEKLSFVLILVVWLYGTLRLAERRSGHVIMLLGGLLAAVMPAIHMRGTGAFVRSGGAFFFIWTLFALGAIGTLTVLLAARGLRRGNIMTAVANENPDRRG
ncbi:MAG TPA: hypothetical protein VEK11_05515 [Thermoanaerobaculia bacterium]|jgi:hypothetical protein|nr:hypothetical protein [Thermoanaerobaculia bacterium]